jgi:[histone H3]-trimethyl-L-lysine4 demethylase
MKGMPSYLSPREEPHLYSMEVAKETLEVKVASNGNTSSNTSGTDKDTPNNKKRRLSADMSAKGDTSAPTNKKAKQSQAKTTTSKTPKIPAPSSKQSYGANGSAVASTSASGCQACGIDDDHANLLLCETCETEMHTYCLDPPLDGVPEDDWFCGTLVSFDEVGLI